MEGTLLELIRWGIMGFGALLMYLFKRTVDQNDVAVEKLKIELQDVKLKYLHRDDFKEFKSELRGLFEDLKKDIKELRNAE